MNKELSENTELSHYRIVSKIGAGGMGEVFLATDTKLGRKVALKFLPREFATDPERRRRLERVAPSPPARPGFLRPGRLLAPARSGRTPLGHPLPRRLDEAGPRPGVDQQPHYPGPPVLWSLHPARVGAAADRA